MFVRNVSLLSVPATSFVTRYGGRRSLSTLSSRCYSASTKNSKKKKSNIQVPTWIPDVVEDGGYQRPVIQWYPGHIAKAERLLKETFQAVDVVVEVRDARAIKATSHPKVAEWVSGRPRLVVFTHVDMIPTTTYRAWQQYHEKLLEEQEAASPNEKTNQPQQYLWVNAKQGQGIPALHRAIFKAGSYVQERRARRGLKDRPLRVGLMGYPNVGKSALINRLLGRKRAKTANIPGVTRSLQWIRVRTDDSKKTNKKEYELLDSPGIIPASLDDQSDALLLASCHCIGEASYDNQVVASYLCQWMQNMMIHGEADLCAPQWRESAKRRWGVDPLKPVPLENPWNDETIPKDATRYVTGEEILYMVADNTCKGKPEDASRKILQDFRSGRMGPICLQQAPTTTTSSAAEDNPMGAVSDFTQVPDPRMGTMRTDGMAASLNDWERLKEQQEALQRERAQTARETAKERGLELPPMLENQNNNQGKKESTTTAPEDVGKGMFDGW